MKNSRHILTAAVALGAMGAVGLTIQSGNAAEEQQPMSFFVTSSDQSGNLGGLEGADAICQRLAEAAGAPDTQVWRAYLSTQGDDPVNARDRIGTGPWYNAEGEMIARNVAELHGDIERNRNYLFVETALDENGNPIVGRERPEGTQNKHDIITGSDSLGYAYEAGEDRTCNNWTSDNQGSARVGHHDRSGGGTTSWNSAHNSQGCSLEAFNNTGGAGKFYCFAEN